MLRRPSFEEKYRGSTASPAGSVGSRSDSPSAVYWDVGQQSSDMTTDTQSVCRQGVARDIQSVSRDMSSVARDTDILSTAARPFVAVTSRTRSPAVVNSRPVSGPTRQFISSPPVPPVISQVHTMSSVPSSAQAVAGLVQSVPCVTLPVTTVSPPTGFHIAAATALPTAQIGFATSPLDCQRDIAVTSSPLYCQHDVRMTSSSVVHCGVPTATSSPASATARNSRPPTVVLQQVHSWEVAWPSAQRATTPQRATAPMLTRVTHDDVADSGLTSPCHDVTVTMTPATVTSSSVSFALPFDRSTRSVVNVSPLSHDILRVSPLSHDIVNVSPLSHRVSPLSHLSAEFTDMPPPPPELVENSAAPSEKPQTSSEKPPPPYPGCAAATPRPTRPVTPTSDIVSLTVDDRGLSDVSEPHAVDSDLATASLVTATFDSISRADIESIGRADMSRADMSRADMSRADMSRTAEESTDEDVAMTTECQRIESPKPVRRAGDDNRCETKVRADYYLLVCESLQVYETRVPSC